MIEPIERSHDDHEAAQALMPWYVTGTLDPAERSLVETHLMACAECRSDLAIERRLKDEISDLPIDVEQGWRSLRLRLEAQAPPPARGLNRPRLGRLGTSARAIWRASPAWLGWALAAQVILLIAIAVQPRPDARYHTLGAAGPAAGNVVVIFRPETRERELRNTLQKLDARLVDGPTAADAYLVRVPAADRASAIAALRSQPQVELAEAVDPGGP